MRLFVNDSIHARVWPSIQRLDGRTLELGPGEEAELDLPDDFEDGYLRPSPKSFKDRFSSKKVLKTPDPLD